MASKFNELPAKAEPLTPTVEESTVEEEKVQNLNENESGSEAKSPLSHLMESNSEFVDNLWKLLQKKLEIGEDEEALKILGKLVEAQPSEMEWKYLRARLLSEMGKIQEAREAFEEILALNPLSFEALFENALIMDRGGERDAVIERLERALNIAMDESKAKEARDVRLIIAQIQFLQKKVDEALKSYEELIKEDPHDFRPYFCKGMIYSLLDRNSEAREQFAKYRELSPKKYEVEGYLRTPLSRMKLFGTDSQS
ncbi:protein SLOW GREEN 1 chloroplastic [Bienertia sinuspersici]